MYKDEKKCRHIHLERTENQDISDILIHVSLKLMHLFVTLKLIFQDMKRIKDEIKRLQEQEREQKEQELEMARQRQKAIDDLDRGVGVSNGGALTKIGG